MQAGGGKNVGGPGMHEIGAQIGRDGGSRAHHNSAENGCLGCWKGVSRFRLDSRSQGACTAQQAAGTCSILMHGSWRTHGHSAAHAAPI